MYVCDVPMLGSLAALWPLFASLEAQQPSTRTAPVWRNDGLLASASCSASRSAVQNLCTSLKELARDTESGNRILRLRFALYNACRQHL